GGSQRWRVDLRRQALEHAVLPDELFAARVVVRQAPDHIRRVRRAFDDVVSQTTLRMAAHLQELATRGRGGSKSGLQWLDLDATHVALFECADRLDGEHLVEAAERLMCHAARPWSTPITDT